MASCPRNCCLNPIPENQDMFILLTTSNQSLAGNWVNNVWGREGYSLIFGIYFGSAVLTIVRTGFRASSAAFTVKSSYSHEQLHWFWALSSELSIPFTSLGLLKRSYATQRYKGGLIHLLTTEWIYDSEGIKRAATGLQQSDPDMDPYLESVEVWDL